MRRPPARSPGPCTCSAATPVCNVACTPSWAPWPAARPPGFADLPRLPYTRAVISEAVRLYPPAWVIGRTLRSGLVIGSWHAPAGSTVAVSPLLLHHDPRWFRDPPRSTPAGGSTTAARTYRGTPTCPSAPGRGPAPASSSRGRRRPRCWPSSPAGGTWRPTPGTPSSRVTGSRCGPATASRSASARPPARGPDRPRSPVSRHNWRHPGRCAP
jgi:hypothetical protein